MPAPALKKTNFLKRIFCVTISPPPSDRGCWSLDDQTLAITLAQAPELEPLGGSLRLEDEQLPDRVLIVHGIDDRFYAYANHCACGGFKIDPVPGEEKIRCCTPMQSTYDYAGNALGGHVDKGLTVYPVNRDDGVLRIDLGTPQVMAKIDTK